MITASVGLLIGLIAAQMNNIVASTSTSSVVLANSTSNNNTHRGFPDLDNSALPQLADDAEMVVERHRAAENKLSAAGVVGMRMGHKKRQAVFCSRVPTPTTPTTTQPTTKGRRLLTPAECMMIADPTMRPPECNPLLADQVELAQAARQLKFEKARYQAIHRILLAQQQKLLLDKQLSTTTSTTTTTQPSTSTTTKRRARNRVQDYDEEDYDYEEDEDINKEIDSPISTRRRKQGGRGGQRLGKSGGRRGGSRLRGNYRNGQKALLRGRAQGRHRLNMDSHRNAQHDDPRLKEEGAGL